MIEAITIPAGKFITTPGLYRGIPLQRYHRGNLCEGPSTSSSELRTLFTDSPADAWIRSPLNPNRLEEEEKAHYVLGRAAHHLFLGEDDFSTEFIVRPPHLYSWRSDAAKRWRAQQESEGRTALIPAQMEQIRGMAGLLPWQKKLPDSGLANNIIVRDGILNGLVEHSFIWRDKKTGLWLKARPDAVPTHSGDFADLKTTSATGDDLDWEIYRHRRYDMQAAMVRMGARALGIEFKEFHFVFVGVKPPHSVQVLAMHDRDLDEAAEDLRSAIDTFAYCLKSGRWFGHGGTQSDARYSHKPERLSEQHQFRREFLERETREHSNA